MLKSPLFPHFSEGNSAGPSVCPNMLVLHTWSLVRACLDLFNMSINMCVFLFLSRIRVTKDYFGLAHLYTMKLSMSVRSSRSVQDCSYKTRDYTQCIADFVRYRDQFILLADIVYFRLILIQNTSLIKNITLATNNWRKYGLNKSNICKGCFAPKINLNNIFIIYTAYNFSTLRRKKCSDRTMERETYICKLYM